MLHKYMEVDQEIELIKMDFPSDDLAQVALIFPKLRQVLIRLISTIGVAEEDHV